MGRGCPSRRYAVFLVVVSNAIELAIESCEGLACAPLKIKSTSSALRMLLGA